MSTNVKSFEIKLIEVYVCVEFNCDQHKLGLIQIKHRRNQYFIVKLKPL